MSGDVVEDAIVIKQSATSEEETEEFQKAIADLNIEEH